MQMSRKFTEYRSFIFVVMVVVFFAAIVLASNGAESASVKALINVRIIDAVNEYPVENGIILIRGNVI